MFRLPQPERRDYAAFVFSVAIVVAAYVFVSDPIVRYTTWLVVFVVWMVWFVSATVRTLPYLDR